MNNRVAIICALSFSIAALGDDDFAPFTNEAASRGLNYLVAAYGAGPGVLGSGLCTADLDGDGETDIVAMGKASGIIGVFRNLGDGIFSLQVSGVMPLPLGSAVAAGDYDSDGDLDLVFSQMGGAPRLCRQDAPFVFTDVTQSASLTGNHAGRSIAWVDADGDGRLDILMACYSGYTSELENSTTRLWRNQGDGTFSDVTVVSGLGASMKTFVACAFDFDHDGDADLYFSNDRGHLGPDYLGNRLYRNDGGVFTDASIGCGANPGYYSMGVGLGDLDENGLMDLMTTNIATADQPLGAINPLFMATEIGVFEESSVDWGIVPSIANETGWAVNFFDANNDCRLDVFLCNQFTPDRFFVQGLSPTMQEMAHGANLAGPSGVTFCSVIADVDGDGGLDILSNHSSGNIRLMMNNEAIRRSWLALRVRGEGRNRDAVGARLRIDAGGHSMIRQVLAGGTGYLGMNDLVVHAGCGDAAVARVQVWWPNSSISRTVDNLPTSKRWSIYPPSALGDGDQDGDADAEDLARFELCAAANALTAGCEMFDFDGDSDLDQVDLKALNARIAHNACDLDDDGVVSASDLAILLANWGNGSSGDVDGSGLVDAADLTLMLAMWGEPY